MCGAACYVLLLFGPGSFLVAHTDDEYLALDELGASIQAYTEIVICRRPTEAELLLSGEPDRWSRGQP